MRQIKARLTSHRCDDRCMYAIGHICNCSCGGKNHGRGPSMPSMFTAEEITERPVRVHTSRPRFIPSNAQMELGL